MITRSVPAAQDQVVDQATRPETAAPPAVDLSIVIVSWNVRDLLRRCLQSLEGETSLNAGAQSGSDDSYSRPITIQAVVVERAAVAEEAERILGSAGGRLTLLPLDSVQPPPALPAEAQQKMSPSRLSLCWIGYQTPITPESLWRRKTDILRKSVLRLRSSNPAKSTPKAAGGNSGAAVGVPSWTSMPVPAHHWRRAGASVATSEMNATVPHPGAAGP